MSSKATMKFFSKSEETTRVTTVELAKLKLLTLPADVASSLISRLTVYCFFAMFILLLNFGLRFGW
jgi:hypothetical protein